MKITERQELFRALVGSTNYNLNRKESDKDYKVFVAPSFEDLYNNKYFNDCIITETMDLDIHDIRKLPKLLSKSNISFLELLFSDEVIFDCSPEVKGLINQIFEMKDKIATMNLPNLFNSCIGMYHSRVKNLEKATEGTKHLVEKYGYNTKEALHIIRTLRVIIKFANQGFKDFKSAIYYTDEERQYLFDIKDGLYQLEEFKKIADCLYQDIISKYEDTYKSQKINTEVEDKLTYIVKEIVALTLDTSQRNGIKKEFKGADSFKTTEDFFQAMVHWEHEMGEDFIDSNETFISLGFFIHWLRGRGIVSSDKFNLYARENRNASLQTFLAGCEDDWALFPYGKTDEEAHYKGFQLMAEYLTGLVSGKQAMFNVLNKYSGKRYRIIKEDEWKSTHKLWEAIQSISIKSINERLEKVKQ